MYADRFVEMWGDMYGYESIRIEMYNSEINYFEIAQPNYKFHTGSYHHSNPYVFALLADMG